MAFSFIHAACVVYMGQNKNKKQKKKFPVVIIMIANGAALLNKIEQN